MINDSDKVNAKFEFLRKIMDFSERDFKLLFWFFALLTIPVIAYIYTLAFSLLLWLISELFGLSKYIADILTKVGVFACFIFAIGTQFYVWKLYKNKRVGKNNPFT